MLTLSTVACFILALVLVAFYYYVIDTFMAPVEGDEEYNL